MKTILADNIWTLSIHVCTCLMLESGTCAFISLFCCQFLQSLVTDHSIAQLCNRWILMLPTICARQYMVCIAAISLLNQLFLFFLVPFGIRSLVTSFVCIHLGVLWILDQNHVCFQEYLECIWLDLLRESIIFVDIVCCYKIHNCQVYLEIHIHLLYSTCRSPCTLRNQNDPLHVNQFIRLGMTKCYAAQVQPSQHVGYYLYITPYCRVCCTKI